MFVDLCNDLNFLLVFLLGYAVAAADDEGMKEVIERGRWYNFIIGRIKKQTDLFSHSKSLCHKEPAKGEKCPY